MRRWGPYVVVLVAAVLLAVFEADLLYTAQEQNLFLHTPLFFEQQMAPVQISTIPLLDEPEVITQEEDEEEAAPATDDDNEQPQQPANTNNDLPDDLFFDGPAPQQNVNQDFDDDFFH